MDGKALVTALRSGTPSPRPPYIPILGTIAHKLGQVDERSFAQDPAVQCRALTETAGALGADGVTVGVGTPPAVSVAVVERLKPLSGGRALVGCLSAPDVAGARAYCEAGVDLVFLLSPDFGQPGRFRTVANACRFYQVPAILVAPELEDAVATAAELGLDGAVTAAPRGDEPGIVGGGLSERDLGAETAPAAPRSTRFFWTFCGEAPPGASAEQLAALGRKLRP